jgi:asparagine N-glycosylation enzyme membrane subunit Stt3
MTFRLKYSPRLIIGILIAIFFAVSLFIRTYYPHDQVFVGDWIKFTTNDAYYQMRLVDNMAHNFPHITAYDPYLIYPGGGGYGGIHFFNYLLAFIAWIIGWGSPTQHTVDMVSIYYPAVLAALCVIPAYFIGKTLFSRWAGVLAAGLVAILPGEFMGRSILGCTDTHVAETLFTTVAIMFLILALKAGGQGPLTWSHLVQRDWKVMLKPLLYSLFAGVFLGIYLITWGGALLFVFIMALALLIQFFIDHFRHRSTFYLGFIGFIMFLVAVIIYAPFSQAFYFTFAVIIAMIMSPVLAGISMYIAHRGWKPYYYPVAIVVIGGVFLGIFYAVRPDMVTTMLSQFAIFTPGGSTATTTQEMQPFLSPMGSLSTEVAFGNFTTSLFLIPSDWSKLWWFPGFAIIPIFIAVLLWLKMRHKQEYKSLFLVSFSLMIIAALVLWFFTSVELKLWFPGWAIIAFIVIVYLLLRQRGEISNGWSCLVIWTLVIFILTLVQRRFAYYLVINIALLSAYLSWQAIWWAGLKKLTVRSDEAVKKAEVETTKGKKPKKHKESYGFPIYHVNIVLAVIVVFFFVFFPNIPKAKAIASQGGYPPANAWEESLLWMKDNTPEPLGDADAYYQLYDAPPAGEKFQYPDTAYGVTAWWDFGYFITRTAHRLPNANPSQDPESIMKVADLFLSQNESTAREILAELQSSYLIIDYDVATMILKYNIANNQVTQEGKLWAILDWAKQNPSDLYDIYLVPYDENTLVPKILFYPAYYRSTVVRLYNFDGKAVTEEHPWVIEYDVISDKEGYTYKIVNEMKDFSSYQDALNYVESQGAANHCIIGSNPFSSPIPLEALDDYRLVYSSNVTKTHIDFELKPKLPKIEITMPEVKIFEYLGK